MINVLLNYYNFDGDWAYQTLSKYINSKSRVLVLPLAFRDSQAWGKASWRKLYANGGEKYDAITNPFMRYGIQPKDIQWINYFDTTTDMARKAIKQADVILLTGGLPEKILERLDKLQITDSIVGFNGVLLGVSAGAMVQLDNYHITPDDDYPQYIAKNRGLSIVGGFDIEVHYEHTVTQIKCAKQAVVDNGVDVIAMYHEGGIVLDNCQNFITIGQTLTYSGNKNK